MKQNSSNVNSKSKIIVSIAAIGFILYNVVLFAICGFKGHGASFWISYAFMLVAFATLSVTGYALKRRDFQPKDWMLGFPVFKHSTIYIVAELILSILFMALDAADLSWWIAFVAQFVALGVHLVFILMCFLAQQTITDVQVNTKRTTSFIKFLGVEVETIITKTNVPALKDELNKFAEQVRYSDPVSNELLADLERKIALQVSDVKNCIILNDISGALQHCEIASQLLIERNNKCKVLK